MENGERTYTYQLNVGGESHEVRKDDIDKYGWDGYFSAYPDATVRMQDDEGNDYDVPLGRVESMGRNGLKPFTIEHREVRKAQSQDTGRVSQPETPPFLTVRISHRSR